MSTTGMPDEPADHLAETRSPSERSTTRYSEERYSDGRYSDGGYSTEMVPSGWLAFAGLMLLLVGFFNIIEGLAVLFRPDHIAMTGGRVMILDFTTWGWILMLAGIVQIAASAGVMNGKGWARGVGIAFALFNALVQLALLTAFPFWSILAIAINIMVIYGLTAPMQRADTV